MLASRVRQSSVLPLLIALFALSGVSVSTLYWSQSMASLARADMGSSLWTSLMPSAALAGYALGVGTLAALARDMTTARGVALHASWLAVGLAIAAVAPSAPMITLACLLIGIGCSLTQRALACAASAVSPEQRGPVIGCVISSGLVGIIVARALVPAASAALGWRVMFSWDAGIVCCCGIAAAIAAQCVDRRGWEMDSTPLPAARVLWRREPILRRAALQQGFVFALFNLGWAVFPRLVSHDEAAGAVSMGVVASLGAAAALATGWACRRRRPGEVARSGLYAVLIAGPAAFAAHGMGPGPLAFAAMALLDIGTQTSLVANQAQAQTLATSPAMRGRVAAIVTTVGFAAGALGAAIGNAVL